MMIFTTVVLALSASALASVVEERQYHCYPPPNGTTTSHATTSVVTMSFNSTTSTTVITFTSDSPGATGTGTGTGVEPSGTGVIPSGTGVIPSGTGVIPSGTGIIPSGTGITSSGTAPVPTSGPPYTNTTSSSSTTSFETLTTSANVTTSSVSLNTTSSATATSTSPIEPTPSVCLGENFDTCDGTCTDLATDRDNCGECGNACPRGTDQVDQYTCRNGVCTRPPCDSECGAIRACGPSNSTCICATTSEEEGLCLNGEESCSDHDFCISTDDCGFGEVCVPNTCCSVFFGVCLSTKGCANTNTLELSRTILRLPENGAGNGGEGNTVAGKLRVNGQRF